jgi:hypothetical protein
MPQPEPETISGGPETRYTLDDPRPIAKSAPYTFFPPAQREIDALTPGDLVQLIFRSIPQSEKYGAERMWVRVNEITQQGITGCLDNDPFDIPLLKSGAEVRFQPHHIISVRFADGEVAARFSDSRRDYWDRCLVDDCVLNGDTPVGYIYREKPDMADPDDKYPDSGWRIRGDQRNQTDEELDATKISHVALGAVLNRDDSWLHLIDAAIGSSFTRDFTTGEYLTDRRDS